MIRKKKPYQVDMIINKKSTWIDIFCVLGMMLIVFFISINHLIENNGIKIYGDELGYWRNAALLTRRDWSGEASLNAYYGYGYGFLLAPILLLFHKHPEDMMHAAVVLQGIMLSSCILASWLTLKKMNIKIGRQYRTIISLFCILYPANIFYVKFSLSEIVLTTCIWWISYLALCYCKSKKVTRGLGIIFLSVYMFSVHQRMITMVLTALLLVVFISVLSPTKSKTQLAKLMFSFGFVLISLLCICKLYDSYYINQVYRLAADGGMETNRIDANAKSAILSLFSFNGILSVIVSFCGKLFYLLVGTYGFAFFGLWSCVRFIIKYIKTKENLDETIWYLYIFLNYMMSTGIASIAMRGGFENRSDYLLYGRYSEFTYGPILLSSLIYLYILKKSSNKEKFIGMIIILVLGLVCFRHTYNQASNSNFWANCTALSDLRAVIDMSNKEIILIAILRCVCVIGIMVIIESFFQSWKKYLLNIVLMIAIVGLWIHTTEVSWCKNVMPWYVPMENAMYDIVDGMENENIFIVFDATFAGCLQFLLPDVSLQPCISMEEIMEYGEGIYVITNQSSDSMPYVREHFIVDKENDRYVRWRRGD